MRRGYDSDDQPQGQVTQNKKMPIHPTAIVDPSAEIANGVDIGPFCLIGPKVRVAEGCRIGPYTQINWTELGKECILGSKVILGTDPQSYNWTPVDSWVKIGDGAFINDCASIHRSTLEGESTWIGEGCYIMSQTHIGHDCVLGREVTVTTLAGLSGHVEMEDYSVIGGAAVVHQFVRVGKMAMIGGQSRIVQDVPPYFTVVGVPAVASGLNTYALKKYGMAPEQRKQLKTAYRTLVRSGLSVKNALAKIMDEQPDTDPVGDLVEFIKKSSRGLTL